MSGSSDIISLSALTKVGIQKNNIHINIIKLFIKKNKILSA